MKYHFSLYFLVPYIYIYICGDICVLDHCLWLCALTQ